MTGRDPDAAGRDVAGVGFPPGNDDAFINLLSRLRERWWIIAIALLIALAIAGVYLALASPEYDVTALLMAEQPGVGNRDAVAKNLASERRTLLSPPILNDQIASYFPRIEVNEADQTLTITIATDRPRQAAAALTTMLDAYLKTSGNQPASIAATLTELTAERDKLAAERDARTKALTALRTKANLSGTETDAVVHARREQLAQALSDAKAQVERARAEAQAAADLPADPVELASRLQSLRARGIFRELDKQLHEARQQIEQTQTLLESHKQTLLPQHPLILQTQKKLDQLQARETSLQGEYPQAYRTHAQQQLAAAERKVTELAALLAQQTKQTAQSSDSRQQIAQLEAEVKQAGAALAEADRKIREATVSGGSATRIKLIQPPTAPDRPARPRQALVLLSAAAIGLALGLVLALAGRR